MEISVSCCCVFSLYFTHWISDWRLKSFFCAALLWRRLKTNGEECEAVDSGAADGNVENGKSFRILKKFQLRYANINLSKVFNQSFRCQKRSRAPSSWRFAFLLSVFNFLFEKTFSSRLSFKWYFHLSRKEWFLRQKTFTTFPQFNSKIFILHFWFLSFSRQIASVRSRRNDWITTNSASETTVSFALRVEAAAFCVKSTKFFSIIFNSMDGWLTVENENSVDE